MARGGGDGSAAGVTSMTDRQDGDGGFYQKQEIRTAAQGSHYDIIEISGDGCVDIDVGTCDNCDIWTLGDKKYRGREGNAGMRLVKWQCQQGCS